MFSDARSEEIPDMTLCKLCTLTKAYCNSVFEFSHHPCHIILTDNICLLTEASIFLDENAWKIVL